MLQHVWEFGIGSIRRTHEQSNTCGIGQTSLLFTNFQIDQLKSDKTL